MNFLHVHFATSGVETWVFLPPLVGFLLSFLCCMGGVSGAFLLLPFQMSFLGYTAPSVSATNFLYNVVAIPSGVYRYLREGRMTWSLTWVIVAGTLPGILLGYYARVTYMPNTRTFKLFVGTVLLYVGSRLLYDVVSGGRSLSRRKERSADKLSQLSRAEKERGEPRPSAESAVKTISFSIKATVYEFRGERYTFSNIAMFGLALAVGVVAGAYGVGGGAIISPFCIGVFQLPVYTVAGATLLGTFITSIAGVLFYCLIPVSEGISTAPDWLLGFLFGIGGLLGMYCGAKLQRFVPERYIKLLLGVLVFFVAARYVGSYLVTI